MKIKIGYAGLSHLGINYAVASATKGFDVVGFDNNSMLISSLKKKKLPFFAHLGIYQVWISLKNWVYLHTKLLLQI